MTEQDRSRMLAAGLRGQMPQFDTHGFFPDDVETRIDQFLAAQFSDPLVDSVRIVYGRGQGIMDQKVVDFLKNHPLVGEVKTEVGSCIVVIDR